MDWEGRYIKNSTVASKPQVLSKLFHLVEGFLLFYFSLFTLNFTNLELHAYRIRIRSTREEASKYFFPLKECLQRRGQKMLILQSQPHN